jgi:hypothetical protein
MTHILPFRARPVDDQYDVFGSHAVC